MATHRTAVIPFSRLIKIGIWSNQTAKTTLTKVYSQLQSAYPGKEIYISNCGFFSMVADIPAIWGLKADGKVYSNDWSKPFMAMKGKTIKLCEANTSVTNYTDAVSAFPVLIEAGKKSSKFSHCLDNTDRGRTMLGYNDSSIILSCIADTAGTSDFTLDEELNYMLKMGCTYAINLDGGGSTQCNFNGSTITSSRKVSNFVYMVVEPEQKTTNTTTTTTTTSYSIGSVIKLKSNAVYTNGKSVPNWVKKSTLYCRVINNNGTVVISTQKTGAVTGTVNAIYIEGTGSTSTTTTTTTTNPTETKTDTKSYKVKVNCSALYIRSGASTKYKTVGTVKRNEIYTIVETVNGWGKLEDGRGWICLTYTKKI